ncbi:MAG: ABC transporter permease subunit [Anaerolineales bacterium]|nr:ABC transporter permease subunit [Anaerolineales bacterium]
MTSSKEQIDKTGHRPSPIRWFLSNARWHGAEWWVTVLGGLLLVAIIGMTLFASKLAPYDPIEFVGAPFNRPGALQSVIVLVVNKTVAGVDDLSNHIVGVVGNSQAEFELKEREIPFQKFNSIRKAVGALQTGEIDALVADKDDPKYKAQLKQQNAGVRTVGKPFGRKFILGTDNYGRDVLSRVICGAQTVLGIAILAALISAGIGIPTGLLSGFLGGLPDRVISLIMDSVYAFPGLILAIAMAALLGPGMLNVAIAIAVIYVPVYFRLVRSKVLSVKEELYVEAGRSLGARAATILLLYIFPNVIPSIVVIFSVNVADSILTEAGLSFLGLGLPPPTPDWGFDLSAGKRFVPSGSWWIITYPGLMIGLLTLGFSMLGEGLNEILNPRLAEK